jgi:DNA-binding beta-propeller fold protein YncE
MISKRIILAFCAASLALWAAALPVGGPSPGLVFDARSHTVRPMIGIPGAAYLGAAVVSDANAAFVAPDASTVLTVDMSGGVAIHSGAKASSRNRIVIPGALGNANLVAWAPDSNSVAIYSGTSGRAQILVNLAKSPSAGEAFDLSALPGTVSALAFDGQQLLLGVTSDNAGGVYSVTTNGAPLRIAAATAPSAILVSGGDLYFADRSARQLWRMQGFAGQSAPTLFTGDSGVLASPAGLALSMNGKQIYLADAGSRKLAVYDVAAASLVRSQDLDFTPTMLARIGSAPVLLLNDGGAQDRAPIYVLTDAGLDALGVYFVPVHVDAAPLAGQAAIPR